MKIKDYLKSNKIYIFIYLLFIALFNLNVYIDPGIEIANESLIYLNLLFLLILIVFVGYDFFKKKNEFDRILDTIRTIDSIDVEEEFKKGLDKSLISRIKEEHTYWMNKMDKIENELKDANDYMTDWIHQVKIPISILEIMSKRIDDADISKNINREIKRIDSLVEQALYIIRSGEYSSDFSIEEVNIDKIIKGVIKKNRYLFIYNKLEIDIENSGFSVYTDRKWIAHIIELIIDNACKYSHEGGKIEIFPEQREKSKVIHIKDYGEGIDKVDLDRIFEKGFTGKNGRNRFKSTGMGLYISKKILTALGDDIEVNSGEGEFCDVSIIFNKEHDFFDVVR